MECDSNNSVYLATGGSDVGHAGCGQVLQVLSELPRSSDSRQNIPCRCKYMYRARYTYTVYVFCSEAHTLDDCVVYVRTALAARTYSGRSIGERYTRKSRVGDCLVGE